MTAKWSKGAYKAYPYYLCGQPGCVSKGKSINKEKVEQEFAERLQRLTPSAELFTLAGTIFSKS